MWMEQTDHSYSVTQAADEGGRGGCCSLNLFKQMTWFFCFETPQKLYSVVFHWYYYIYYILNIYYRRHTELQKTALSLLHRMIKKTFLWNDGKLFSWLLRLWITLYSFAKPIGYTQRYTQLQKRALSLLRRMTVNKTIFKCLSFLWNNDKLFSWLLWYWELPFKTLQNL